MTVLPVASGGGFQPPTIDDFFPQPVLAYGTWLQFDRIELVRIVAAAVVLILFVVAAHRAKLVPGRFQAAMEWVLDFVRKNVVNDVLGEEKGRRHIPLLTTIFVAILAFNLTGIIPGLNIAGTSRIGLPLLFAVWVYISYLAAGVREHGVLRFLKNSLFPPGVPWFMYILLTPVEFLQVFIIRPATLALRLMANMVAGHLMLALCFIATEYFLLDVPAMKAFSVLTFVSAFAMMLFEAFVAALQAYIFTILAAVYISLSTADEH
ncbi:MAG: F0F1 ATP synthase subunit A [Micrococcales bacterium]|nr:F0F1 ATP synthase subunit A [Micrococcales bacterium]